jgi:hypothetical protein
MVSKRARRCRSSSRCTHLYPSLLNGYSAGKLLGTKRSSFGTSPRRLALRAFRSVVYVCSFDVSLRCCRTGSNCCLTMSRETNRCQVDYLGKKDDVSNGFVSVGVLGERARTAFGLTISRIFSCTGPILSKHCSRRATISSPPMSAETNRSSRP